MTKSQTITISETDIEHLATLANLSLTQKEKEAFQNQLTSTLEHAKKLDELDTSNVEPTSHSTCLENVFFEDGENLDQQLSVEDALANAPKTKNNMFVVQRII